MVDKPTPLTQEGYTRLQQELEHLRTVRRPEVLTRIQQAKDLADFQHNAEYDDAKNEQAFVEGRIITLDRLLKDASIIDEEEAHQANCIQLGSTVTVLNHKGQEERYTIVGSAEADPNRGRISNESPVGMALLGKREGAEVEVQVPAGSSHFVITHIS